MGLEMSWLRKVGETGLAAALVPREMQEEMR